MIPKLVHYINIKQQAVLSPILIIISYSLLAFHASIRNENDHGQEEENDDDDDQQEEVDNEDPACPRASSGLVT